MQEATPSPSDPPSPSPRLVRVVLRTLAEDSTLALTPDGSTFRIDAPRGILEEVLARCDGRHDIDRIIAEAGVSPEFSDVISALARAGSLVTAPPAPRDSDWVRFPGGAGSQADLSRTHILLLGDPALVAFMRDHDLVPPVASVDVLDGRDLEAVLAGVDRARTIVVALLDRCDVSLLEMLDDRCSQHHVRWTQLHLAQEKAWLGPAIEPASALRYRDVLARRLCAADDPEVLASLLAADSSIHQYRPPATELAWVLSTLSVELERWIAGAPSALLDHEIEADPVLLRTTVHPVLALPVTSPGDDDEAGGRPNLNGGPNLLMDERTGIVTSISTFDHSPAIPTTLTTVVATVGATERVSPWRANPLCGSSVLCGDWEDVKQRAIGEAMERYCGNWIQSDRLISASYQELTERGEHALNPASMVLYSGRQYAQPGFPFVPFAADLNVHWMRGESLTRGLPAWIPASFVYVSWFSGPFADDPPTNFALYSGIACGVSREHAMCAALEELIERHATMVWWSNLPRLPTLENTKDLAAIWTGRPAELGQRAWLIPLDNSFGVPVMAGVVENVSEGLLTTGYAARADPVDAALKAWSEALTLQETSRDLLRADGVTSEAIAQGRKTETSLKPWRADRSYLDSFRSDFRDVADLECQLQVCLDPRAIERVRPWLRGTGTRDLASVERPERRSLATYRAAVERAGHEVFAIDITTTDVAATGLRVARVVVPGLVPNFPSAFPFLGKRALQDSAVGLGWRETALDEEELNTFPLPHA